MTSWNWQSLYPSQDGWSDPKRCNVHHRDLILDVRVLKRQHWTLVRPFRTFLASTVTFLCVFTLSDQRPPIFFSLAELS